MTRRAQKQRLALAIGLKSKNGAEYVIGGDIAPSETRLGAALCRMGYSWGRLTRDQAEDIGFVGDAPGEGEAGHHFADDRKLPFEVQAILDEEISGPETVDGPMTLAWHIQQVSREYFSPAKIQELIGDCCKTGGRE